MSKQRESDPRFKAVNSDPRFHSMPKKEQKVKLDDRFKAVVEQKEKFDHADEFYYVDADKDHEQVGEKQQDAELAAAELMEVEEEEEDAFESDEENVARGEQTSSRLALQNYDWSHLTVKNIYMLFHTLAEAEFAEEFNKQRVKRVDVYLSDFGEEQLKVESTEGPRRVLEKAVKKAEGSQLDDRTLRRYEKDRLKYYYAVIQFDSARTAEKIYENYDGLELEFSGCKLDLRFVPETLEIPKSPEAVCDGLTPEEFKRIPKFINKALGHSNVELTWDAPIDRNIEEYYDNETGDIDGEKIKELVALEDDEDADDIEEDAEDIRAKLLSGTNVYDDFNKNKKKDKDIVVTFKVGFGEEDGGAEQQEPLPKKKEYRDPNARKSKRQLVRQAQSKKLEKKREKRQTEGLELLVDGSQGGTERKPFVVDLEDERFAPVVSNPKFAVDPTHPKYDEQRNKVAIEKKKKISK